jgi:imidazolonepropionase-like amidohydrolase
MEKELGTVERGKVADLLIVAGDPLADLESLGEARLVIHNGTIIRDETAHQAAWADPPAVPPGA